MEKCIYCDHCEITFYEWSIGCKCTYNNYSVEAKDCCKSFSRKKLDEEEVEVRIINKDW